MWEIPIPSWRESRLSGVVAGIFTDAAAKANLLCYKAERLTISKTTVDDVTNIGVRKRWIVASGVVLTALSALSFVNSIGAAFAYSDWLGLPAMANKIAGAKLRADFFFLLSLALALVASIIVASLIRLEAIEHRGFRVVARYITALAVCVFATGIFVLLLGIIGPLIDP